MVKILLAVLGSALLFVGPAAAVGPGPNGSPFLYVYPDIYYDFGGVMLPKSVPGGSKGVGTINVTGGFYVNGVNVLNLVPSAGNSTVNDFTCDGTTTNYTLSATPKSTVVWIGGVYQNSSSFTVTGAQLALAAACPNGVVLEARISY